MIPKEKFNAYMRKQADEPHPATIDWTRKVEGYIPVAKRITNAEGVVEPHKTVGTGHYMSPANEPKLKKLWGERYAAIKGGAKIDPTEDRLATGQHLRDVVPKQLDTWNPNWRKLNPQLQRWLKLHTYALGDNLNQFEQGSNAVNALTVNPSAANMQRLWDAFWKSKYRRQTGSRMEKLKPLFESGKLLTLRKRGAEKITEGIAKGQTVETEPTEAQKESENYKKAHVDLDGLKVSIENPYKSTRSGTDADGTEWSQTMWDDYGYIKGSVGYDKDHLDVFINPGIPHDEAIWDAESVYVVNQLNADDSFDEHKCMLGYVTKAQAKQAYRQNYEDGWDRDGSIIEMPWADFKKWALSDMPSKGECTEEYLEKTARIKKLAKIILDIDVGDTVLVGRFKNKPVKVESIGTDENGQPIINGRKLLALRIAKLMPKEKKRASTSAAAKDLKKQAYDASKEWIGVDLDGTLAKYTEWKGSATIGKPIPRMVTKVKQWLKDGKTVKILTARASGDDGTARRAIAKWTKEHIGQELPVTCIKDMYCTALYDDKAKGVTKNKGKIKTMTKTAAPLKPYIHKEALDVGRLLRKVPGSYTGAKRYLSRMPAIEGAVPLGAKKLKFSADDAITGYVNPKTGMQHSAKAPGILRTLLRTLTSAPRIFPNPKLDKWGRRAYTGTLLAGTGAGAYGANESRKAHDENVQRQADFYRKLGKPTLARILEQAKSLNAAKRAMGIAEAVIPEDHPLAPLNPLLDAATIPTLREMAYEGIHRMTAGQLDTRPEHKLSYAKAAFKAPVASTGILGRLAEWLIGKPKSKAQMAHTVLRESLTPEVRAEMSNTVPGKMLTNTLDQAVKLEPDDTVKYLGEQLDTAKQTFDTYKQTKARFLPVLARLRALRGLIPEAAPVVQEAAKVATD